MTKTAGLSLEESLSALADHYGERVETMGPSAKAAGWRDTETQHLRFRELFRLFDGYEGDFSLNDLGCGYGEIIRAMPERIKNRMKSYNGYDISESMVKAGNELFAAHQEYRFFQSARADHAADFTVASGIFNHHFDTEKSAWKMHIQDTIRQMHSVSRKGIAFNIMSTKVDFQEDYIHYHDPAEMLDFCLRDFGRHVILLHDYPLYEFTVLIRKAGA